MMRKITEAQVYFFLTKISSFNLFVLSVILLVGGAMSPAVAQSQSEVQAEALKVIAQLPDRALSLELVLALAAERSDSIKAIRAGEKVIHLPLLQAGASLEPRAILGAQRLSDRTQPANPFSPSRNETNQFSAGLFKATTWGSELGFEVSQGYSDIGFAASSPFTIPPYYESKASLSVTQSLGANRLGYSTRRQLQSAGLQVRANALQLEEALEEWAQSMAGVFYSTWLAQRQAQAAQESLQRRIRLRRTVQVGLNRGTVEEADFFQVEAAVLLNENQSRQALQVLGDRWRDLIFSLRLPQQWQSTPLLEIPLRLDEVVEPAKKLCANREREEVSRKSLALRYQNLLQESAQLEVDRAQHELQPKLELQGRYFINAIESERSQSLNSLGQGDHRGWSLGIQLVIPFDFSLEKMQLAQAQSQQIRSEALFSQQQIQDQVSWTNECANLARLAQDRLNLERALDFQRRRVQQEDRRFQLGRTTVFSLIQAADDLTQAELNMSTFEVEVRQASWRVLALAGQVNVRLETIVQDQTQALKQGGLQGVL